MESQTTPLTASPNKTHLVYNPFLSSPSALLPFPPFLFLSQSLHGEPTFSFNPPSAMSQGGVLGGSPGGLHEPYLSANDSVEAQRLRVANVPLVSVSLASDVSVSQKRPSVGKKDLLVVHIHT